MSKVAIKGNTSGTGTFTVEAPNSNTDRTLVLPDSAGTIATTNGITQLDMWRVNTSLLNKTDTDYISSGWERVDDATFGYIGDGMTESSGIFSFPTTGYWTVDWILQAKADGARTYIGAFIKATADNSSYDMVGESYTGAYGSNVYVQIPTHAIIKVQDITNYKVQLWYDASAGSTDILGDTGSHRSSVKFVKIGDL